MEEQIGVVDLFSGPGGLGEGFSNVRHPDGSPVFQIDLSVEKDLSAFKTLRLRAFLRKFGETLPDEYIQFLNRGGIDEPSWETLYPREWQKAVNETLNLTLGAQETYPIVSKRLKEIRKLRGNRVILIGGPPCQAYSLAGRGRKPSDLGYVAHVENRHRLYEQYIDVLRQLRPAAFVMENVKGMLSSKIENKKVFDLVTQDLIGAGGITEYALFPLTVDVEVDDALVPRSFVVEAERYGVPQARHRVIITGIRKDLLNTNTSINFPKLQVEDLQVTVRDVLKNMPSVRSGISVRSGGKDNLYQWKSTVAAAADHLLHEELGLTKENSVNFITAVRSVNLLSKTTAQNRVGGHGQIALPSSCPKILAEWLQEPRLNRLSQHETRSHMKEDLARYLFATSWALATGASPKAVKFPKSLAPKHKNWTSGKFPDRFRVQCWDQPGSTIVCHISKDGNYFIHPDPSQCRSLTVREAARLQTFPDNYFFKGNRTQQYIQLGNAVPPFLAWKIGNAIAPFLKSLLASSAMKVVGHPVAPDVARKTINSQK